MKRCLRQCVVGLVFLPVMVASACGQEASEPPSAAVVAKVAAAKRVFVDNQGADRMFQWDITGDQNVCYDEFYASLKAWGHFELVEDPAQADLIFTIGGSEHPPDSSFVGVGARNSDYTSVSYPPMLQFMILEPGTGEQLYLLTTPAGRGKNIPTGKIAFANSINGITAGVMAMVGQNAPLPPPATLLGVPGPVPALLEQAKTVYLTANAESDLVADFQAAMKAWGRFTLVDSPQKADLVVELWGGAKVKVIIYTGPGQNPVWTLIVPNDGSYSGARRKKRDLALVKTLTTMFKGVAGGP